MDLAKVTSLFVISAQSAQSKPPSQLPPQSYRIISAAERASNRADGIRLSDRQADTVGTRAEEVNPDQEDEAVESEFNLMQKGSSIVGFPVVQEKNRG